MHIMILNSVVFPVSTYQNVNKIKQGLDFLSHITYSLNLHQISIIFLWAWRVQMKNNSVTLTALPRSLIWARLAQYAYTSWSLFQKMTSLTVLLSIQSSVTEENNPCVMNGPFYTELKLPVCWLSCRLPLTFCKNRKQNLTLSLIEALQGFLHLLTFVCKAQTNCIVCTFMSLFSFTPRLKFYRLEGTLTQRALSLRPE